MGGVGVGSGVVVVVGGIGGSHIHGCTQVWWKKLNFVPGAHDRLTNCWYPVHKKNRVGSSKSGHIVAKCSCVRHSGNICCAYDPAMRITTTSIELTRNKWLLSNHF